MSTLELRSVGQPTWTAYAMDTYIAPHLSKFTGADIPDQSELARRASAWLTGLLLRSLFNGTCTGSFERYGSMLVRRAAAAVRNYELARIATRRFLETHTSQMPALSLYVEAADAWDAFVAQAAQALNLVGRTANQKLFQPGDQSLFERVHELHDDAKHAEDRFQSGSSAQAAFTLWLTNEGLESRDHRLSWIEASALVAAFEYLIGQLEPKKGASDVP